MIGNFCKEAPHVEIVNAAILVNEVTSGPLTQADESESISIRATVIFSDEQVLKVLKRDAREYGDILLGDFLERPMRGVAQFTCPKPDGPASEARPRRSIDEMASLAAAVMAMRIMRRALTGPGPWASSAGPARLASPNAYLIAYPRRQAARGR
jgi:hypothetical protein